MGLKKSAGGVLHFLYENEAGRQRTHPHALLGQCHTCCCHGSKSSQGISGFDTGCIRWAGSWLNIKMIHFNFMRYEFCRRSGFSHLRLFNDISMFFTHANILFLAATKQLYEWYFLSVCPSVRLSVRLSHLFDYVPIIVSSWNFQELSHWTRVRSMQKVKVRGQRSRSQRSRPKFSFPDCNSSLNSHMMMKWYI